MNLLAHSAARWERARFGERSHLSQVPSENNNNLLPFVMPFVGDYGKQKGLNSKQVFNWGGIQKMLTVKENKARWHMLVLSGIMQCKAIGNEQGKRTDFIPGLLCCQMNIAGQP